MSSDKKVGDRQRKSTGRRSSILKRQDTYYFGDATEVIERTNTPSKRRVSFASTATVRTFETLPWQSHLSDDSGSTSVHHSESDALPPRPSLLMNVNQQCPDVAPPPSIEHNASAMTLEDHQMVDEPNKTIMFSQFNESDCAMEITTNVSQLSHSWLDHDNSLLENDTSRSHHNCSGFNITNDSEPRVIFPWNNKGSDNVDVEKTHIFLSTDDDNMEFTRNLTGFPSLSARFLTSNTESDSLLEDNLPKQYYDHGPVDDMTADMEMTGVIETAAVPKRRSVLVDLTENKNLTPIEEVSVSSMYTSVSDHEHWTQQNKGLNFSQVCAKLDALGSSKKFQKGTANSSSIIFKPNSPFASPPSRVPRKQALSGADKDEDPEVSFNFRPCIGSSPQSKQKSNVVTSGLTNGMEQDEKTVFNASMEMTNTHLDGDVQCDQNIMDCMNGSLMDITNCRPQTLGVNMWQKQTSSLNSSLHHNQGNSQNIDDTKRISEPIQDTLYMGDMEMTQCISSKGNANNMRTNQKTSEHSESNRPGRSQLPEATIYNMEDMVMTQNVSIMDLNGLNKSGNDSGMRKIEGSENTVFAGEMEITHHIVKQKVFLHCEAAKVQNLSRSKDHDQKAMEMSSSHPSGRSESPQKTVHVTEDMNVTSNLSIAESSEVGRHENDSVMEGKTNSGEKTLFDGDMEMNSSLTQHCTDKNSVLQSETLQVRKERNDCSVNKDCGKNTPLTVESYKHESKSDLNVPEEMGSLHMSILDKFLGSQELDLHQSVNGSRADENDSLHDSISLSEIAGMKSPKKVISQGADGIDTSTVNVNMIKSQGEVLESADSGAHQSILDCVRDASFKISGQKSLPGMYNGSMDVSLNSQAMELEGGQDGEEHSISLSEIAGLKSPPKQIGHEMNSSSNQSRLKSSSLDNSVFLPDSDSNMSFNVSKPDTNENVSKGNSSSTNQSVVEEGNKSMDFGKEELSQKDSQFSEQDKKKAALRKSICNEMMFPKLASKGFSAKSFSHLAKPNTVGVAKFTSSCPESTPHKPEDGGANKAGSSKMELDENKTSRQPRMEDMRLSSDFFEGEGLLDEGDCPTLEDAFDNIPLNESVQEDLVFSYMRSIIEAPGDDADEKNGQQTQEGGAEEFSNVCQALGIDVIAKQIQGLDLKPVPCTSLSDKLNVNFVIKPQIRTMQNSVGKLQEEHSRKQKAFKESVDKFTHNPPQIYKDIRTAIKQGQDISPFKSKVQDISRRCKGSTESKSNRYKADYLMELTLAQQQAHSQQKKDLDMILSDIDRVANISAELDKCMEELDVISTTRTEINKLQKRTDDIESETNQMESECAELDNEIDMLNKQSKDRLHKMKEDEEKELLLLDKISFLSCLNEWSLLKQTKTKLVFGFLSKTVILNVCLSDGDAACQKILDISFRSRLSSKSTLWARISHQLLLSSLDEKSLMKRFHSFQQLKSLLSHVSDLASVSRDLCAELKDVHLKHNLKGEGLRIQIQLSSHECQQKIKLSTTLQSGLYTTQPLDWQACALLSTMSSTTVEEELNKVPAGVGYITQCLQTVLSLMTRR